MKPIQNTDWFSSRRVMGQTPPELAHATKFTRTGEHDAKRYGGPGKRSKNPIRYDNIGREMKERANAAVR